MYWPNSPRLAKSRVLQAFEELKLVNLIILFTSFPSVQNVIPFSCFRDWFTSFIRGRRSHQEDHENTKERKNASRCASGLPTLQ